MSAFPQRKAIVLMALLALCATSLSATSLLVQRMDLAEICDRSDKIFRGTVVSVTPGSVSAGGADFPTNTYLIKVEDAIQGTFDNKGGDDYTEITMLGNIKPVSNGDVATLGGPEVPSLELGETYVLMTSAPSAIGLSAPIGMGQGCYHVTGDGKDEVATNEVGDTWTYEDLANTLRAAVAQ